VAKQFVTVRLTRFAIGLDVEIGRHKITAQRANTVKRDKRATLAMPWRSMTTAEAPSVLRHGHNVVLNRLAACVIAHEHLACLSHPLFVIRSPLCHRLRAQDEIAEADPEQQQPQDQVRFRRVPEAAMFRGSHRASDGTCFCHLRKDQMV
jgi:hypothetical protein